VFASGNLYTKEQAQFGSIADTFAGFIVSHAL
jgi:hypothetical protein